MRSQPNQFLGVYAKVMTLHSEYFETVSNQVHPHASIIQHINSLSVHSHLCFFNNIPWQRVCLTFSSSAEPFTILFHSPPFRFAPFFCGTRTRSNLNTVGGNHALYSLSPSEISSTHVLRCPHLAVALHDRGQTNPCNDVKVD